MLSHQSKLMMTLWVKREWMTLGWKLFFHFLIIPHLEIL